MPTRKPDLVLFSVMKRSMSAEKVGHSVCMYFRTAAGRSDSGAPKKICMRTNVSVCSEKGVNSTTKNKEGNKELHKALHGQRQSVHHSSVPLASPIALPFL